MFLPLILMAALAGKAGAQILSFDPERLVSLELNNGSVLSGRIVDADSQQLHLVGPRINRLIPYALLAENSRKNLNLAANKASETAPVTEFQGLNSTRSILKESQQELAAASRRNNSTLVVPYTVAYPYYPFYYGRPCGYYRTGGFSANIHIDF